MFCLADGYGGRGGSVSGESSSAGFSSRRSFSDVLRTSSGVEMRKDLKCLSSCLLDVFPVSAGLVKGRGGDDSAYSGKLL